MLMLALPILCEQYLEFFVGMVDTWLAGNYMPEDQAVPAVAAIGVMAYSLWMLFVVFSALGIGATALVARFIGAGNIEDAQLATNQALTLGVIIAGVATLLLALLADDFVNILQLKGDAAQLATSYLWNIVPAVPAVMIIAIGIAALHGAGDTVSGLIVMATVNVVNIVVSAALTIGIGPIPKLGWAGLSIGTAVAHIVGAVMILVLLRMGRGGLCLRLSMLKPDREMIRRLLRIGIPGGLNEMVMLCCHLWYLGIINSLGTITAAAHGLGVRVESPSYLTTWGFAVAASTMTGQFLGANQPERAQRGTYMALAVGGTIVTLFGVFLFFGGHYMVDFYLGSYQPGDDKAIAAETTTELLKIVAISMPFLAIVSILSGALRGAGDTTWPLIFTLLGLLLIRIPGAYWLAWDEIHLPWIDVTIQGFGYGVRGAWYVMVVDLAFRSMLVLGRYLQGGWKKIEV